MQEARHALPLFLINEEPTDISVGFFSIIESYIYI